MQKKLKIEKMYALTKIGKSMQHQHAYNTLLFIYIHFYY